MSDAFPEARHPLVRRRLGWSLIAYGASGIGIALLGGAVIIGSLGGVDRLTRTLEAERLQLVATLDATVATLDGAAVTADGFATSIEGTRRTAVATGRLVRDFASTLDEASVSMNVSILGNRPFEDLSAAFARTAERSRAVADELDAGARTLDRNVDDVGTVAAEIGAIRVSVRELRTTLVRAGPIGDPLGPSRVVLLALLAWLAIPAVASLWIGLRLVRDPVSRAP